MATQTQVQTLKTAIGTYGHTRALKDGSVSVPGVQFDHVEITPIINAFRRMCRTLEFDISEMAITTYLTAKAYNKPFTALPVFVVRQFHHSPVVRNTNLVQAPKDIEGKRVGVRAYTVTAGVWARGILHEEYGVDLDRVTWVLNDEEHVNEFHKDYPRNVEYIPGANFGEMLAKGELAAAIGAGPVDSPDVKPMFADARNVEAEWFRRTGLYPINHTVVVKDSVLQADPGLAPRLFNGFKAAKEQFLKEMEGGNLSREDQAMADRRSLIGPDPLPYGIGPNRKALETIIRYAHEQHILPRILAPEAVFAPGTQDLQ